MATDHLGRHSPSGIDVSTAQHPIVSRTADLRQRGFGHGWRVNSRRRVSNRAAGRASPSTKLTRSQARQNRALRRDAAMTDRIIEFLARPPRDGPRRWPVPRRRPRRRARQLHLLRQGVARHARVLRGEGQSRAGSARRCSPLSAPASTRPRSSRSSRCSPPAATPDRISFGNTIKKERDIARAYALGVRLFAVDCEAEVEKIARVAPGSRVFCRILCDGAGAEWPLSRKFGCVARDGGRRARARASARPRRARPFVPCRLAAAQPAHVGRRAEGGGGRSSAISASAASICRWSISAAAFRRSI